MYDYLGTSACYERTEVHCIGWTSLPVSDGTEEANFLRSQSSSLGQRTREDKERTWDLAGHTFRVVAK